MKKVLSLLLVGAFSLALAGCVQIDETPYEVDCEQFPTHVSCLEDVDPEDPDAPGIINVLDALPTEDITITFWHTYGQSKGALLDEMIAEFMEEYPNITVEAKSQGGYDEIREAVGLAIRDLDTPTVVVGYPDHIAGYLIGSAVVPLDDFIKHETWGVDTEDFVAAYLEENTQYPGGYYYSFPFTKSTEMMVYNKDLIEANATAIETALGEPFPTDRALTWAELDLLAGILVDPNWDDENPTPNKCNYLVNYDSAANFFINNTRMWDGGYTNNDGDILVDDTNTIAMLDYVGDRFADKVFAIPIVYNEPYGSTNFIAGNFCMSVGSTAGINYNIPSDGAFEVGVVPVPQYSETSRSAQQQGPNIAIMSNSTDAERLAAWLLIKHLTNAENTAAWAMETGYLPVRYSGFNSDDYQAFLDIDDINNSRYYASAAAQAAFMQNEYFQYDPPFANEVLGFTSADARVKADEAMEALFAGRTSAEVIADMLAQLGAN